MITVVGGYVIHEHEEQVINHSLSIRSIEELGYHAPLEAFRCPSSVRLKDLAGLQPSNFLLQFTEALR